MSNQHFNTAPILFLIFNRPDITKRVFEQIKKAKPERLYIAADGPRSFKDNEATLCKKTREVVSQVDWECDVKTLFRDENLGCKDAVSSAITWFFNNEPEGIILEDDCLPSDSFFYFCTTLLEKYRDDERIAHIAGSNFQDGKKIGNASYYFSDLYNIWGWASWRRVWKDYDVKLTLLDEFADSDYVKNAQIYSHYKSHWLESFQGTKSGKINTWDYQYMFANVINHRIAIVPNVNLISNIGFGEGATHTTEVNDFANIPVSEFTEITHPKYILPDLAADTHHMHKATWSPPTPPAKKKRFLSRIWKAIKKTLKSKNNLKGK